MKKVSIIIPTRNRAHLLQHALKSAAEQDYKNLEVIVCDNFSTDDTEKIVSSFKNKNIIYVRTSQPFCMSDNWEFALSKSNGEYITFLTDSCYLFPDTISVVMEEVEKFNLKLAVWKNSIYFYPDWIEQERRNNLYIPKTTNQLYILSSKEILEKCFNNVRAHASIMPRAMNSLCHRSLIEKAIKIQSRFFLPPNPDYSSGLAMLLNSEKYLLIDKPLYIASVSKANNASGTFIRGSVFQDFIALHGGRLTDIAFLGIPVSPATIAKNFEDLRKFYLDICPKLNMENVLREMTDSIAKLQIYGTNVKEYWDILNEYILRQNKKIKLAMFEQKIKSKIKWFLVKKMRYSFYLSWLEILRGVKILKGDKLGFNNIEEAAKILMKYEKIKL